MSNGDQSNGVSGLVAAVEHGLAKLHFGTARPGSQNVHDRLALSIVERAPNARQGGIKPGSRPKIFNSCPGRQVCRPGRSPIPGFSRWSCIPISPVRRSFSVTVIHELFMGSYSPIRKAGNNVDSHIPRRGGIFPRCSWAGVPGARSRWRVIWNAAALSFDDRSPGPFDQFQAFLLSSGMERSGASGA